MIFSLKHIAQIQLLKKNQTRRPKNTYRVGNFYGIQEGRGKPKIKDGALYIKDIREEKRGDGISVEDALAEGGYTPQEYEDLYERMWRGWIVRFAYTFMYVPFYFVPTVWWQSGNSALEKGITFIPTEEKVREFLFVARATDSDNKMKRGW